MPTPTYTPLATVTLAGTASSVTFNNIPATYRDLIFSVEILGLSGNPATSNGTITINGTDGTSVYMYGTSSSQVSSTSSFMEFPVGNFRNFAVAQIMDYSATDKHKTILQRMNAPSNAVWAIASRWASTSAVTSVSFNAPDSGSKTFNSGSTFSLYGVIA
jgi:hypothetical protein